MASGDLKSGSPDDARAWPPAGLPPAKAVGDADALAGVTATALASSCAASGVADALVRTDPKESLIDRCFAGPSSCLILLLLLGGLASPVSAAGGEGLLAGLFPVIPIAKVPKGVVKRLRAAAGYPSLWVRMLEENRKNINSSHTSDAWLKHASKQIQ